MKAQVQSEGITVVLVGHFNPAIFTPYWFAEYDLIRVQEAESAEIHVVHPDIASFDAAGIRFQVTRQKFSASTVNASCFQLVRDVVVGTFHLLEHTPIVAIGINRDVHVRAQREAWERLSNRWVARDPFRGFMPSPAPSSLSVESERADGRQGQYTVKVEPSQRIQGVYLSVNDEIRRADDAVDHGCREIIDVLEEGWHDALTLSEAARDMVIAELNSNAD